MKFELSYTIECECEEDEDAIIAAIHHAIEEGPGIEIDQQYNWLED